MIDIITYPCWVWVNQCYWHGPWWSEKANIGYLFWCNDIMTTHDVYANTQTSAYIFNKGVQAIDTIDKQFRYLTCYNVQLVQHYRNQESFIFNIQQQFTTTVTYSKMTKLTLYRPWVVAHYATICLVTGHQITNIFGLFIVSNKRTLIARYVV